jgi:hypothetical protein
MSFVREVEQEAEIIAQQIPGVMNVEVAAIGAQVRATLLLARVTARLVEATYGNDVTRSLEDIERAIRDGS